MGKPSRPSRPEVAKNAFRTFFITTRTAEGKALLQSDRMATLLIEVLRNCVRERKFKVHDFVVMRNHVHLLITVGPDMTIEKAMQLIKGTFSYRAGKEFGIRGEIWQRGFSDVRVKDEESFRAHQKYIYDNPVKAGMSRSPEEFPHCSLYLRRVKAQGLKPTSG